jgi:hypothetical protein
MVILLTEEVEFYMALLHSSRAANQPLILPDAAQPMPVSVLFAFLGVRLQLSNMYECQQMPYTRCNTHESEEVDVRQEQNTSLL